MKYKWCTYEYPKIRYRFLPRSQVAAHSTAVAAHDINLFSNNTQPSQGKTIDCVVALPITVPLTPVFVIPFYCIFTGKHAIKNGKFCCSMNFTVQKLRLSLTTQFSHLFSLCLCRLPPPATTLSCLLITVNYTTSNGKFLSLPKVRSFFHDIKAVAAHTLILITIPFIAQIPIPQNLVKCIVE